MRCTDDNGQVKIMFYELRSSRSVQLVFAVSIFIALSGIYFIEDYRYNYERLNLQKIAITYANHIKNSIYQSLSATYPLAALVHTENGNTKGFEELAYEMMSYYPGVAAMQLAPQGIVSQIVPLQGNEKALGHNLLEDPSRTKEAFLAKETGQLTLAGPFNLVQGGIAAVGRLPVYLKNKQGTESFWGFAIVLIRFPEIFNTVNFNVLVSQGIAYRLTRIHPDLNKEQMIASSKNDITDDPVCVDLDVPNATWKLSMTPSHGWHHYPLIAVNSLLGGIFVVLVTSLAIFLKRKEHEKELEFMAYHDALTHLPNRILLLDRFTMAYAHNKHIGTSLAVCFIDLDHFKQINDTYSHEVGDRILVEATQRILKCIREEDTLSRQGGDEFILLLGEIKERYIAQQIVQRILETLAKPYCLDEYTIISISASVGITFASETTKDLEVLIQQADSAMYAAKLQGRNGFVCYTLI